MPACGAQVQVTSPGTVRGVSKLTPCETLGKPLLSRAILALFFRECHRYSSSSLALQQFGYCNVLVQGHKNTRQTEHLRHFPKFFTAHAQWQQFQKKIVYGLGASHVTPFFWSHCGKLNFACVTIGGIVDNHFTGWHQENFSGERRAKVCVQAGREYVSVELSRERDGKPKEGGEQQERRFGVHRSTIRQLQN